MQKGYRKDLPHLKNVNVNKHLQLLLPWSTTKNSRSGLTGFIERGYDPVTKEIFLGDYAVAVQPIDNKVELKVIVDQTSVELFTSDGSHWITMAVFTDPGVSRELHAFG